MTILSVVFSRGQFLYQNYSPRGPIVEELAWLFRNKRCAAGTSPGTGVEGGGITDHRDAEGEGKGLRLREGQTETMAFSPRGSCLASPARCPSISL